MNRRSIVSIALLAIAAYGQAPASRSKLEFEAASIRVDPPRTGFHFATTESTGEGGPGTDDPEMYRCVNCTLAALIGKAFAIQNYQFPGRSSLLENTFDVMARVPAGATREDFQAMLQTLLKERFALACHFTDKGLRGYHLVIAKNGSKLKESTGNGPKPSESGSEPHGFGPGQAHSHNGLFMVGGSATYRGDHKTTAELARILSDQLGLPVEDQTGLTGRYDVSLAWTSARPSGGANHAEGAGHGYHEANGSAMRTSDDSGPTLFEALQSQLGLKLIPSEQTTARILVVDHVNPLPTAN